MPLIVIHTNLVPPKESTHALLLEISSEVARTLGKPESYVMTLLPKESTMTFGGTTEPACYLELKNIGTLTPAQTTELSELLCSLCEAHLSVSPTRTYIEFSDAERHLWGWNNKTFA